MCSWGSYTPARASPSCIDQMSQKIQLLLPENCSQPLIYTFLVNSHPPLQNLIQRQFFLFINNVPAYLHLVCSQFSVTEGFKSLHCSPYCFSNLPVLSISLFFQDLTLQSSTNKNLSFKNLRCFSLFSTQSFAIARAECPNERPS